METKSAAREYTLDLFDNKEEITLDLDLKEGWNWVSHNMNNNVFLDKFNNAVRILGQTEETYNDKTFGFVGDISFLKPVEGYKIQMPASEEIEINGLLFNSAHRSIYLSKGWNWIGYPLAHEMEIAQALEPFSPSEDDLIVGQDGFATFYDGEWVGALTTLKPGKGYMYKSASDKRLIYNTTATSSSRMESKARMVEEESPWSYDCTKYPNVMPIIAQIYDNGSAESADNFYVAAFCSDECRGIGYNINGLVMMNVFGNGNENITFKLIKKGTEELFELEQAIPFKQEMIGKIAEPYHLMINENNTSVDIMQNNNILIFPNVIKSDMTVTTGQGIIDRITVTSSNGTIVNIWNQIEDGTKLNVSNLVPGIYMVTIKSGNVVKTEKIIKVNN